MGAGWPARERSDRAGMGVGWGIPLPHQGVFALSGFKVSDLVHNFGEFVGILSIQKVRKDTRSRNICLCNFQSEYRSIITRHDRKI